jgi:hypothetical protein
MAGFRTFATGEVLTAANVNDFLMEQSVMTFADATARTTALADVLREGLLTYNEDTAQLEIYDGSAWVLAAPEPPAGIGSNVVQAVKTDTFTTSSGGWVDVTDLSVTITPTSATSKILILTKVAVSADNVNRGGAIQVVGGNAGTFVGDASSSRIRAASSAMNTMAFTSVDTNVVYLDSPATTSPVTYKVQAGQVRIGNVYINRSDSDTGAVSDNEVSRTASSIVAIEVEA